MYITLAMVQLWVVFVRTVQTIMIPPKILLILEILQSGLRKIKGWHGEEQNKIDLESDWHLNGGEKQPQIA